ncbi:hypothetical protein PIB30_116850 [Stylosanthes scabra]|uniref:Reverse transcriptase Ty1/copia-type domain-containing protein n=1 Tax=Stylosanthes scabra TaxID=79078 RepID=A0ABU6VBP8_9FABA|nr:hypothetical protein [Stylosanthes scabra]
MRDEIEALKLNQTWKIVECPPQIKPIGCKWVYKIKRLPDGTIDRYKACLVAKGYTQIEGVDFLETFSPVVKPSTIRIVLALASIKRWPLQQLDVNNTFLHSSLNEDVYMALPPGLVPTRSGQCCKLLKSLYGLRQSSRMWYEKLSLLLLSRGYKQTVFYYSLFIKIVGTEICILLVYVDDIVITGNSLSEIASIKRTLDTIFKIKDLGTLKYFLGIEVAHSAQGISLSQHKYCLDLLSDSGLLGAKPASTPMDNTTKLSQHDSPPLSDPFLYRRLVGRLFYLTTTRPDITYVTKQLSQFMASPTQAHYRAALRVLRYLKNSPGKGIFLPRSSSLQILGFNDSDWAGCLDTRCSLTGFCFFLGDSLIFWKTKKQTTVARSSTEAEYRALANTTCKLQWILNLLKALNISCSRPPVLYCDNRSALHIAANSVFHERTKHLEVDCHLVRQKAQAGVMKLLHVPSSNQLADIFTKPLSPQPFHSNLSKLGILDIYHPRACGGILDHNTITQHRTNSDNTQAQ